ncbi:nitroreductase [Bacillaceae bacterium S4-13-58]
MDILECIKTRRSVGLVKDDPVPKDLIEKILETGTWAPSHFRTEPWKFFVMEGEGRKRLGRTLVKIAEQGMDDPMSESNQKKLQKTMEKPFRAPVVIAVAVEPTDSPKVIEKEEYGAVYTAIQNMILAAHGLGLGGYWRTGAPTYHPLMKELFGLSERGEVLGFLYFGYPKRDVPEGKRRPFSEVTTWITKDEE